MRCVVGELETVFVEVCVLDVLSTVDVLVDVSGGFEDVIVVCFDEVLAAEPEEEAALEEELIFARSTDEVMMIEKKHTRRVRHVGTVLALRMVAR